MNEKQHATSELLTETEHQAIDLAGQLYTLIANEVVCYGPNRAGDLTELRTWVHAIQHMVMAQAAARAHPDLYRRLGGMVST